MLPTGCLTRFENLFIPEPNTGCWLWIGAHEKHGYGRFKVRTGESRRASRVSWELYVGDIPDGLSVLHRCDEPGCVNPDHLFLGTQAVNVADMVAKGRQARDASINAHCGEEHGNSKLTEEIVAEIRRLLPRRSVGNPGGDSSDRVTRREVAVLLGVSESLIKQVVCRKAWRHVGS